MSRAFLIAMGSVALSTVVGCGHLGDKCNSCNHPVKEDHQAKTLFEWSIGPKDDKGSDDKCGDDKPGDKEKGQGEKASRPSRSGVKQVSFVPASDIVSPTFRSQAPEAGGESAE